MVTVNITVTDEAVQPEIYLGRQGEKQAREIVFDLSALREKYGAGTATLYHQRAKDPAPYLIAETTGTTMTWTVSETDTVYAGIGYCEFRYTFGAEGLSKSTMFATNVKASLSGDVIIPAALQAWYDALIDYIDTHSIAQEQLAQAVADYIDAHPLEGIPSGGIEGQVLVKTSGADYDAKWSDGLSDLKSAFDDASAFSETLGYIPPSFTNSDFVNGMWANGVWRTGGTYAKARSVPHLIPIGDYLITANTSSYVDLVLAIDLYDTNGTRLGSYRVGGPNGTPIYQSTVIQSGSYEILKPEAINTNANSEFLSITVGKLTGGAWADLPTDLVLQLRKQDGKAESIIRTVEKLTDAVESTVDTVDLNKQKTVLYGKYIKADGTYGNASAHKVVTFNIKNVKQIGIHALANTGVVVAVIEDSEGNVITSLDKPYYYEAETKYDLSLVKDQEYTVFVNFFSYKTVPNPFFDSVNIYYDNAIDFAVDQLKKTARKTAIELPRHSVFKPFDFDGKTAAFFGDSITVGVINGDGSQVTTNNYPNGFSAKVGLTPTNKAVSGSRIYVPSGTSAAKILSQLQSVTLSDYDFIFIAGGINDFMAYTVEQMLIGLTELISYVKANFTGDVIWITPINTAKNVTDVYKNKKDLNDYIAAMTKLIKESDSNYQFSVVQGWEFGFPAIDSDSTFKNAMFGDGELHPSELGYNTLYVPGLLTALC